MNQTLKTLAGTSLRTYRETAQAIQQLETKLGLPASPPIFGIGKANNRIRELESELARTTQAAAASAPAAPAAPRIGLPELSAMHTLVFGSAATGAALRNDANFRHGADRIAAARAECDKVLEQYGEHAPISKRAQDAKAAICESVRLERAGTDAQKITRLAKDFHEAGLLVPGLNISGMGFKLNLNNPTGDHFSASEKMRAQNDIATFSACLSGEPDALQSAGQAAASGRKFLLASGKADFFGNITLK
jgi:hypothetical protein